MPKTALVGALALTAWLAVPALAASVEVNRGSSPTAAGGVTVLRGEVPRSPAAEPPAGESATGPTTLAGDKVWFVDDGRLVGCRLVNTVMVGVRAVECAGRRVPIDRLR